MAVPALQLPRMGEQSPACNRHRRRHGLGDDAKRLGSDLARPEKDHQVDGRQRSEWHADSRQSKVSGPAGVSHFTRQVRALLPDAVLYGSGEPLPNVREMTPTTRTAS